MKFHAGQDRFSREVRALTMLKHDHICAIAGMLTEDPGEDYYPYSVTIMEFGEITLERFSEEQRPWNMERFKDVMKQILDGLAFVKEKGFVHANMRPTSILYFKDRRWKLGNFDNCVSLACTFCKLDCSVR